MRKYDGKNKRNIGIIVGFCIIFTVIFSYSNVHSKSFLPSKRYTSTS